MTFVSMAPQLLLMKFKRKTYVVLYIPLRKSKSKCKKSYIMLRDTTEKVLALSRAESKISSLIEMNYDSAFQSLEFIWWLLIHLYQAGILSANQPNICGVEILFASIAIEATIQNGNNWLPNKSNHFLGAKCAKSAPWCLLPFSSE